MGRLHCTLLSVVNRTCCPSLPPPPIIHWDETGEIAVGLQRSNQTSRSALDTFHCGLRQASPNVSAQISLMQSRTKAAVKIAN